MIGQMKHILAAEQKKTDFKPEDENNVVIQYTNVSKMIWYASKNISFVNIFVNIFIDVYVTVL